MSFGRRVGASRKLTINLSDFDEADNQLSTSAISNDNTTTTLETTPIASSTQKPQTFSFDDFVKDIDSMTLELEQEEKTFRQLAKNINSVDKQLFRSKEQLSAMNAAIEQLQADQKIVDEDLEYLAVQQQLLKQGLEPLEAKLLVNTEIDNDRQQIYPMLENLNVQLKQTSEGLKDIIDDLNKTTKEAGDELLKPLTQIFKIFDKHVELLENVEGSMKVLTHKLDDISKLQSNLKDSFMDNCDKEH